MRLTAALLCCALAQASPAAAAAESPAPPAPAAAIEALWERGEEAYRAGDFDAALASFGEALARDEGRARSWSYVGGAHFARGEWERALGEFLRATELDPGDARAWNNAGTAAERLGDFGRAEALYRRSGQADPVYPAPHRNLGILYARRLGRPADARRSWLRYLELRPGGPEADEIRLELMRLPGAGAADPAPH
jgi:superkiller protein 3